MTAMHDIVEVLAPEACRRRDRARGVKGAQAKQDGVKHALRRLRVVPLCFLCLNALF